MYIKLKQVKIEKLAMEETENVSEKLPVRAQSDRVYP